MGRPRKGQTTPPDCYTIREFCDRHRIGLSTYYRLRDAGMTPLEIRVGGKVLITTEAAARWRAARDEEAKRAAAS